MRAVVACRAKADQARGCQPKLIKRRAELIKAMVSGRARRCCGGMVVLLLLLLVLSLKPETRRRLFRLHWLPYVLPRAPGWLWDFMHSSARHEGGMWRYGPSVQAEVTRYVLERHAGYASALDMGCNEGFMLARLQAANPQAQHYGTDISPTVVRVRVRVRANPNPNP